MINSKLSKAVAAAVALIAAPIAAQAADMPTKGYYKAPHSVVAYYNWTGFYAGVNAGYMKAKSDFGALGSTSPNGWLAGGTLGYNFQTGAWVWGIEGDFNWVDLNGTQASIACGTTCNIKGTWLSTVRGRVGYAVDRFLPYFTGGLAYGRINVGNNSGTVDENKAGWTAGVGLEYAFLGNWTTKIEYLHVDLGSVTCGSSICTPTPVTAKVTAEVIRAGLNYKFSGPVFSRF